VTGNGWLQILLCIALLLATVKPLGWYLARVFQGQPTPISPLVRPIERAIYRVAGVDGDREQSWFAYALAFLAFHLIGMLLFYALLRLQGLLPLNPAGQMGMTPDLALNTAISFATNTSWESYAGETALSYLSQMAGVGVQSFLSAAAGIAVAVALVRGFARHGVATIGNFWVDIDPRRAVRIAAHLRGGGAVLCLGRRAADVASSCRRRHAGGGATDHITWAGGLAGGHQVAQCGWAAVCSTRSPPIRSRRRRPPATCWRCC
jgi:K+-transporting ATPase A subunit